MPKAPKISHEKRVVLNGKEVRRRRTKQDDVHPAIDKLLASTSSERLVRYVNTDGTYNFEVIHYTELEAKGFADLDNLPGFNPPDHKKALKAAGYDAVSKPIYLQYGSGKKYTLFVFLLTGSTDHIWLSKSGFNEALGRKKDYSFLFMEAAEEYRSSVESDKLDDDGNENEGDTESDIDDATATDADNNNENEDGEEEDEVNEDGDGSEDDSEDQNVVETIETSPRPVRAKKSPNNPKKSLSLKSNTVVGSHNTTKSGKKEIIYARRLGKVIHCLYKYNNGSYDMLPQALLASEDHGREHKEKGLGLAPAADSSFLSSISSLKALGKDDYKLLGCVGIERGPKKRLWKMVVLELTKAKNKTGLQNHRKEERCTYAGPLLCSQSAFEKAVRRNNDALQDALALFAATTLGKDFEKRGIDPREARHYTVEPEQSKEKVNTKLDKLEEKIDALGKALKALGLSSKSKL